MTTEITYLKGDAAYPVAEGPKIIVHALNTTMNWELGEIANNISNRWKTPEEVYRSKFGKMFLGDVYLVKVEEEITVASLVVQRATKAQYNPVPLETSALERCLEKVATAALMNHASIHAGRIGCVSGGGRWETVAHIINRVFGKKNIPVYIYDLEKK